MAARAPAQIPAYVACEPTANGDYPRAARRGFLIDAIVRQTTVLIAQLGREKNRGVELRIEQRAP